MNILQRVENALVEFAATVGPWLAPIPTAFLVGRALVMHLHYPLIIAVSGGVVIELLGLSSTNVALTFYEYNQEKRKTDQKAPFLLALALVVTYFVTATVLTVLLDVIPDLVTWAPIIFPLLSLTGVGVLALRADHRRRLNKIEDDKEERKNARKDARKNRRAEGVKNTQSARENTGNYTPSVQEMNAARTIKRDERIEIVRRKLHETGGDFSPTELADELGVSRRTIYNDLEMISKNGNHS